MNTTVITAEPHDFGAGKDRRIEFVGCKWKVDDRGALHIFGDRPIAAFAPGAWLAATNGQINGADAVSVEAVRR